MKTPLLKVAKLSVEIAGKCVLSCVSCEVYPKEVVAIMGPNGSGKSSFASTLMGDPNYQVVEGIKDSKITFAGENLVAMGVDERARKGMMHLWQSPVFIPGVKVFSLCKTSYELMGGKIESLVEFKKKLEDLAGYVGLSKEHIGRAVNEGFSGGERKRLELLQLLLLSPKLAILDEVDSGLDPAGVEIVGKIVKEMRERGTSFILITHNKMLLKEVAIDKTWEMNNGKLSTGL